MTTDDEPQFDNWKDAWEYNAGQANTILNTYTEDELLKIIGNNEVDLYYQIWDAIAKKGTKAKAPLVLVKYLEANLEDYMDLNRYHCLEALFKICKIKDEKIKDDFFDRIAQMVREDKNAEIIKQGITDLKKYLNL
jgi:hypothetical protein